ncbi:MAG: hypothetical protein ACREMG_04480 [Gemmatimonadales bacterium]
MRAPCTRIGAAVGLLLPALLACDHWSLVIRSDGLLSITVVSNDRQPGDGYRVRTRQSDGTVRTVNLPPSGQLPLSLGASGPVEITLVAPEGCVVVGPNPRELILDGDDVVTVAFEVRCGGGS